MKKATLRLNHSHWYTCATQIIPVTLTSPLSISPCSSCLIRVPVTTCRLALSHSYPQCSHLISLPTTAPTTSSVKAVLHGKFRSASSPSKTHFAQQMLAEIITRYALRSVFHPAKRGEWSNTDWNSGGRKHMNNFAHAFLLTTSLQDQAWISTPLFSKFK